MSDLTAVRVAAQAKINLRLHILAREASGYHQLETLFLRIELADEVRIRRTPRERSLDVSGTVDLHAVGPVETNLAWRAAEAHAAATDYRGGFAIEIEKHIPIGGGLGGGSADAGAVLRAMNVLSDAPLDSLLLLAQELGADVPFLTSELPYALAWGRGDRFVSLPPPPRRDVLLVIPDFSVSTADAYAWLREPEAPARAPRRVPSRELDLASLSSWSGIAPLAQNSFEPVVARRHPEIGELTRFGREAEVALMSGSGSTVFAVARPGVSLESLEHQVRLPSARMIRTGTAMHVEPVIPIE